MPKLPTLPRFRLAAPLSPARLPDGGVQPCRSGGRCPQGPRRRSGWPVEIWKPGRPAPAARSPAPGSRPEGRSPQVQSEGAAPGGHHPAPGAAGSGLAGVPGLAGPSRPGAHHPAATPQPRPGGDPGGGEQPRPQGHRQPGGAGPVESAGQDCPLVSPARLQHQQLSHLHSRSTVQQRLHGHRSTDRYDPRQHLEDAGGPTGQLVPDRPHPHPPDRHCTRSI